MLSQVFNSHVHHRLCIECRPSNEMTKKNISWTGDEGLACLYSLVSASIPFTKENMVCANVAFTWENSVRK